MAAIFDFEQIQTSDSILTSLSVLPDPENMGIAVGILLLSGIGIYIYRCYNILLVHCRHFEFRLSFLSADITVIGGNSFVLKTFWLITVSFSIGHLR